MIILKMYKSPLRDLTGRQNKNPVWAQYFDGQISSKGLAENVQSLAVLLRSAL